MNRLARWSAALVLAAPLAPAFAGLDLEGLDRAAGPCGDFYRFANGKWLDATAIPADRSAWSAAAQLARANEDLLVRLLEEGLKKPLPPEGSAIRKVLQYYERGLQEPNIRHWHVKPLARFLVPLNSVDDRAALARLIGELHTRGIDPAFQFEVEIDRRDSAHYVAEIGQGGLGLPDRDYYFREDARSKAIRDAYRAHVVRILRLYSDDEAAANADADAIVGLETELAKASMTVVERRDREKTYNPMTLEDLARSAPGFPWAAYFEGLRAPNVKRLVVRQPAFFARFAQLFAERPAPQWRAYLRWHVLRAASDKLDARFEGAHFDFYEKTLRGVAEPAPRSRRVLRIISGREGTAPMAEALGQLYVEHAFPAEAKARALALARNVKAALVRRLRTLEWMSPETRARAVEKAEAVGIKIGYPDRWRDYSRANVGPLLFVENWMSANMFEHERNVERIGSAVDRGEWFISPHVVNAYYNPGGNEIVFPAAILQPPFFDPKADDALNYGAIGTIVGHEITHGFDSRGRRFDRMGNMRDWWSPEDSRRYEERAKKVESQYGSYAGIDGIAVNGALTLAENISDIGGLKLAWLAFEATLGKKRRAKVDGFTPEQRFFIAYAQSRRTKYRPEQERLYLRTGAHSLSPLRVRGSLANMPEFARAFSCDPGKVLLPEAERAGIW